jgi:two-component system response regulator YesN
MYKVLIVDDEYTIREGLRSAIDWGALDCGVAGVAKDGLEAMELIRRDPPDIVITDIRMPGKNGLELAEEALGFRPGMKVILLTGFSEFEYARQAVHLGAVDFLLKPAVYDEVVQTISKTVETIRKERRRMEELARFRQEFNRQFEAYRQTFLKNLLTLRQSGSPDEEDRLRDRLQLYGLAGDRRVYVILAKIDRFESVRSDYSEEEWQILLMALTHHMNRHLSGEGDTYLVPLKDDLFAIVMIAANEDESRITALCQELQRMTRREDLKVTLSFGISRMQTSFRELNRGYLEADEALRHRFYLGYESIVFFADLSGSEDREPVMMPYGMYLDCFKPILKSLHIGDKEAARKKLHFLFRLFEENRDNHEAVKTMCIDLLSQMMRIALSARLEWDHGKRERLYSAMMQCETLDDCFSLLNALVGELSEAIYKSTRSRHQKIVRQVLDLIENHFMEDISLTWVSERVHLNSSYISRLLKNETGETFTDLLTKRRMERAKELLRDPHAKIYEVADRVGMEDAHYFSIKFKKFTGMTPSEYRDNFNALF